MMLKKSLLAVASVLLLVGCNQNDHKVRNPENTGVNTRDSSGDTMTSGNQEENESDRKITQDVRRTIIADNSLSALAKNVKIITNKGVVTLRGPVKSDSEKEAIERIVKQVQGVSRVDNQLEVSPSSGT